MAPAIATLQGGEGTVVAGEPLLATASEIPVRKRKSPGTGNNVNNDGIDLISVDNKCMRLIQSPSLIADSSQLFMLLSPPPNREANQIKPSETVSAVIINASPHFQIPAALSQVPILRKMGKAPLVELVKNK